MANAPSRNSVRADFRDGYISNIPRRVATRRGGHALVLMRCLGRIYVDVTLRRAL